MARQNWLGVVIHHSASTDSEHLELDNIAAAHEEKGWDGPGYHFIVELVDGQYVVLAGRPMNQVGAHCKYHNSDYLGVCLVGNFSQVEPPKAQLRVAAKFVAALLDQHKLPRTAIYPHSHFRPTECPGAMFPWWEFRSMVAGA